MKCLLRFLGQSHPNIPFKCEGMTPLYVARESDAKLMHVTSFLHIYVRHTTKCPLRDKLDHVRLNHYTETNMSVELNLFLVGVLFHHHYRARTAQPVSP